MNIADAVLAKRLENLGAPAYRIELRTENGIEGIGLNGDRAWVPLRVSAHATLIDLADLLERERDEPLKRALAADEERSWVRRTLTDFEERVRRAVRKNG